MRQLKFKHLTKKQEQIIYRLAFKEGPFTEWELEFSKDKMNILRDLAVKRNKVKGRGGNPSNGILDEPFKPKTILLKKSKELIDMDREVKDIASLSKLT